MVLFQLGAQEFINGDMNGAVQYFNNAIGMGDYDLKARNNSYYWRGEAHYRMGNYPNAASDFQVFTQKASPADENYAMGWYNSVTPDSGKTSSHRQSLHFSNMLLPRTTRAGLNLPMPITG